ncbi:ABC transporter ATP-binding protein, partial [bacterium]|nr:ABC transporter ATP-binding protein [bacterium]
LEFDKMEGVILEKESRIAELEAESSKPELLTNSVKLLEVTREMGELQSEVEKLYARWAELEGKIAQ